MTEIRSIMATGIARHATCHFAQSWGGVINTMTVRVIKSEECS